MLGGGVDAATLVAALGVGPPPTECRWGRRPRRGAMACRLLERDDRGVDGPGVEAFIRGIGSLTTDRNIAEIGSVLGDLGLLLLHINNLNASSNEQAQVSLKLKKSIHAEGGRTLAVIIEGG